MGKGYRFKLAVFRCLLKINRIILNTTTTAISAITTICSLTGIIVEAGVGLGRGVGKGLCDGEGKNGVVFIK